MSEDQKEKAKERRMEAIRIRKRLGDLEQSSAASDEAGEYRDDSIDRLRDELKYIKRLLYLLLGAAMAIAGERAADFFDLLPI